MACPLKLTLTPQNAATTFGGIWSKTYTEQEAIEEKHVPALVQLLTQDSVRLVSPEAVFALFIDLAETAADLAKVARRSRMLDDHRFDDLIKRIIAAPDGGDEALGIIVDVNRLNQEQRLALRAKAFREASIPLIVKHVMRLRISDAEVLQLADRMPPAMQLEPGVAVAILETFGERLPNATAEDAVKVIVKARASYALSALRHLNFSPSLRQTLVKKVIADADLDDLGSAKLSRENLEEVLSPVEARALIARLVGKSGSSKEWLELAVRLVPIRAMTTPERKAIVNELMLRQHQVCTGVRQREPTVPRSLGCKGRHNGLHKDDRTRYVPSSDASQYQPRLRILQPGPGADLSRMRTRQVSDLPDYRARSCPELFVDRASHLRARLASTRQSVEN